MDEQFVRTQMQLGTQAMEKLFSSKVALFGVGGVGGFCAEALARAGIGTIALFDNDTVSVSNLNRQIVALHSTIGQSKVEVMANRILDINPTAKVEFHHIFYDEQTAQGIDLQEYDYIIDAIDSVSSKLELAQRAFHAKIPIISCMGTGNKLDPTQLCVKDIYQTSVCPLARVMRHELRKRQITALKVVYSTEPPVPMAMPELAFDQANQANRRQVPASNSFVPSSAGLLLASVVIRELIESSRKVVSPTWQKN